MARRRSLFDDLMDVGLRIGWRSALIAAAISFIVLHLVVINTEAVPVAATLLGFGASVREALFHDIALFAQYLLPLGLLIGAAVGFLKQRHSITLLKDARENPTATITQLSWQAFERLVGEAFRQRGFKVTGFGGSGPDGGVDLGLTKNGDRLLVQCKHWKKRQVGVTVVRELYGIISAQRAQGGFVVTAGEFTREAKEFAKSCRVELIDGAALEELIRAVTSSAQEPTLNSVAVDNSPSCPKCGSSMVQRKASQGKFAGQSFWGCGSYPKCKGIVQSS